MEKEEREIKLKDFYSAALLKALGYPLLRLERGAGDFLVFVYDDPEFTAEEQLGRYWEGQITCNAKALIDSIRDLKTMVHQRV
jgi:hypothetical protein